MCSLTISVWKWIHFYLFFCYPHLSIVRNDFLLFLLLPLSSVFYDFTIFIFLDFHSASETHFKRISKSDERYGKCANHYSLVLCYISNTYIWAWVAAAAASIIIATKTTRRKRRTPAPQNKCNIILILRLTCNILMYFAAFEHDRHKEPCKYTQTYTHTKAI